MAKNNFRTLWIEIPEGLKKRNFWSLIFIGFLVNAILPLFHIIQPIWLEKVIKIDPASYGKINANLQVIMEIVNIVFVGYIGILSDRVGRKILLLIGYVIFGLGFLTYGSSNVIADFIGIDAIIVVYILRGINALTFLFLWPQVITLIADYTSVENRGRGMGAINFVGIFGAVISLVLLSKVPKIFGINWFFYLGPILGILGFIAVTAGIVDRNSKHKSSHHVAEKKEWKKVLLAAKKSVGLRVGFLSSFSARADQSLLGLFLITWAVKVASEFGKSAAAATAITSAFIGVNVVFAAISSPLWGFLTDRWSRKSVLCLCLALSGFGYLGLVFLSSPFTPVLYFLMFLIGSGVSGITIASQTMTADLSPKEIVGSVLGAFNTTGAVGIMFFALAGGYLFDHSGFTMPFLLKGLGDILVISYALLNWSKIPHHKEISAQDKQQTECVAAENPE